MHTVVETRAFLSDAAALGMTEEERSEVVSFLAKHPDAGDVIAGTGGARKLRFAGRNKGKSGGYRVITFFTGASFPVFLLNAFAKNEKTNLTPRECAHLKELLGAITACYTTRPVTQKVKVSK
jgi:hypothetical protein